MGLLANKAVLITGAGSGIGRASALLFASEGAKVVCADIRRAWADETVDLVHEAGGTAIAVTCDVTDSDEVAAGVQRTVDEFGRLDVMVNNAGITMTTRGLLIEDHTGDDFDRLVAVNGRGVFYGCREAVIQFKRQGDGGVIVNTGSVAGMVAWGGVPYGATKALVIQLTRALAIEVAPHGIRVNCFCPGGIKTNFGKPEAEAFKPPTDTDVERSKALYPLGQLVTAEDCAQAALYLASDMSSNVTGVALPVDGGYIAR